MGPTNTTITNSDGSTITTKSDGTKHLVIPDLVTSIGKDAFKGKQLTSVSIPASLGGSVDQTAFALNSTLKEVTISGTGAIKEDAFKGIFGESGSSGIALVIEDGITLHWG